MPTAPRKVTPLGASAAAIAIASAGAAAAAVAAVPNGAATGAPKRPGPAATTRPSPSPMRHRPSPLSDGTPPLPAVSDSDDTLAPGARLGFGDETATLAETARAATSSSWAPTAAVPVARSTTRVPPPPGKRADDKPEGKESRGARRRRLGIPRRITPRVIGFVLLVAAVPVAAYFVLRGTPTTTGS